MVHLKEEILKEIDRIEESSDYSSKGLYSDYEIWKNRSVQISISLIISSSIASVNSILFDSYITEIFALLSVIIASFQAYLKPDQRMELCKKSADSHLFLRNRLRVLKNIDSINLKDDELRSEFQKVFLENNELNSNMPKISYKGYLNAKAGIEDGESDFKADKEEIV